MFGKPVAQEDTRCYYKGMRFKRDLLVSAAGRLTVFLYLFSSFIIIIFIQGNFQGFVDESLTTLLTVYKVSAMVFILSAFLYILSIAFFGRNTGRSTGARIAFSIAGILLASAGYILTEALMTVLQPVS
jgi:hypothetical protein